MEYAFLIVIGMVIGLIVASLGAVALRAHIRRRREEDELDGDDSVTFICRDVDMYRRFPDSVDESSD